MFYVEEENFLEELKNGKYVQLNEEGIDKVVDIIEKYENVVNKLEKMLKFANPYVNYDDEEDDTHYSDFDIDKALDIIRELKGDK
jgi:hypothetical protein